MIGLIDIGGTKLLAAVSRDGATTSRPVRRPTPRQGPVIETLVAMLDEVRAGVALEGIAASVPGPFDRDAGVLLDPPGLSAQWHRLALAAELAERFGCPVVCENDANCAALAEARAGAGRGARVLLYWTVSTGIGSGVVRDGHLEVVRHDTEGGHQVLWPAHLGGPRCECGATGCLEALASGRALARRHGRPTEQLEDQAVWDEVGMWLGLATVNATALLDCDRVVCGGGVMVRWPRIEPALRRTVADNLHLQPIPDIRPAELGDDRNLLGALIALHGR